MVSITAGGVVLDVDCNDEPPLPLPIRLVLGMPRPRVASNPGTGHSQHQPNRQRQRWFVVTIHIQNHSSGRDRHHLSNPYLPVQDSNPQVVTLDGFKDLYDVLSPTPRQRNAFR